MIAGLILLAFISGLLCFFLLFKKLKEFPLEPGAWFMDYSAEYGRHFNIKPEEVTKRSAIVEGTQGFVWCTQTPEYDREWFNKRGYDFPNRWLPYAALKDYVGISGSTVRLDV